MDLLADQEDGEREILSCAFGYGMTSFLLREAVASVRSEEIVVDTNSDLGWKAQER